MATLRRTSQPKTATVTRRYNQSALYGWQAQNKSALDILNEYQKKIQNNEWLSSEDRAKYKTAIDEYTASGNALRKASQFYGTKYTPEEEKSWQDSLSSLSGGYNDIEKFYGQFASDKEFNAKKLELDMEKTYSDRVNSADPTKGTAGYQSYLDSLNKEPEKKSWVDTFNDSFNPLADNPLTSMFVDLVNYHKEDTSYMRPNDEWDEKEKAAFGELYLESPEEAYKFAEIVNNRRNKAKELEQLGNVQSTAVENPLINSLGSIAAAPFALGDVFNNAAKMLAGKEITNYNKYDGYVTPGEYSLAVESGITDHLNNTFGTISVENPFLQGLIGGEFGLGNVYGMGMSVAKTAIYGKIGDIAGLGSISSSLLGYFGASASSAFDEALERGANDGLAFLYGLAIGGLEVGTEAAGIDNLTKINSGKYLGNAGAALISQALAEGGEELASAIGGSLMDTLILGENSQFAYDVAALREKGYETPEARWGAFTKMLGGWGNSALTGAITGAVGGARAIAENTIKSNLKSGIAYTQAMGDNVSALPGEALNYSPDSKYAQRMQEKVDTGGKLGVMQVGRLANQISQAIYDNDSNAVKTAVSERLTELGKQGNVTRLASALAKQIMGEELSTSEQATINKSKNGYLVLTEADPENIRGGGLANKWAESIGTKRLNADVYNRQTKAEAANATPENARATEAKISAPSERVSPTIVTKNAEGKTVKSEISGIEVDGGKATFTLANGEKVSADKATFQTDTQKLVADMAVEKVSRVEGFSTEAATAMVKGYTDNLTPGEYNKVFTEAFNAGKEGLNTAVLRKMAANNNVSEATLFAAYDIGREFTKNSTSVLKTNAESGIINTVNAEATNEGRQGLSLRGSVQRSNSQNTQGQLSQLESGAGQVEGRGKAFSRPAEAEAARLVNEGRKVSVADLGIPGGTTTQMIYRLEDVEDTPSMKKAREKAEARGLTVRYFAGDNLHLEDGQGGIDDVRGFIKGKYVYVRADHSTYTADQIMEHELGHDKISKGEVDVQKVRNRLKNILGDSDIEAIAEHYMEAYSSTPLTADEIWEEVICDSLGDMNIFSKSKKRAEAAEVMKHALPAIQQAVAETKTEAANPDAKTVGKASRDFGGKVAKYLSDSKVGKANREYLYHQLLKLYSGISDGIADGIAIANGKTVFIVDSGRDNGKLDFGVRRMRNISADIGREQFIRRANDTARSKGDISDELLERLGYGNSGDSGLNLRREFGSELQADTGKSPNQQSGVSEENADQRGLTKGKASRELDIDSEGNELSPAVAKRFANSKVVDENGRLKVVYHGTVSGEFDIFDKSKGSVEGDFGSGFYFTDKETDVEKNYEFGGPDFDNKVWRRAEQIWDEDPDIDMVDAREQAKKELYKESHRFEVYLNIENPAIVGETILFANDSYLSEYNEEDYDNYDDYIGDVDQLVTDDIDNIIWDIERNVDLYSNTDSIRNALYEAYYEGGVSIEKLKEKINELYLEANNGDIVNNEVTRQIIESLGYDGIIDPTVATKFKNMGMEADTTHYIVFKPNQIKDVGNKNPTDNPNIHYSRELDLDDYSQISNMRVEANKVGEDIRKIEKSEDFKAQMDKLTQAVDSGDAEGGIAAYNEWKKSSGYGELIAKRDQLEADIAKYSKAYEDNRVNRALNEEAEAIKKSGLSEADYFRKEAEKVFGYTPYFYDAGYIVLNGKMLNFSGEKGKHFGSRGEDHRAIGQIYANTQGGKALTRFMNDGNIRIIAESPGVDISSTVEPTKEQYATIKNFLYDYAKEEYFNIDLSDENGRVVGSLEYEGKINPTRVINDIKHYYETGEIKSQSQVDKFRYSRELDLDYLDAVNRGDIETAQRMVDEAAREWSNGNELFTTDAETGEVLYKLYRSADGGRTIWDGHGNNKTQGVFLTNNEHIANAFDPSGKHIAVYAKASNPFEIDAQGNIYVGIPVDESAPEWLQDIAAYEVVYDDEIGDYVNSMYVDIDNLFPEAFKQGYDAVIVTNIKEGVGGGIATDVVLKDGGKQIKSADPVTYDDNGNVIPLSERFNPENKDIRFSRELDLDYDESIEATKTVTNRELLANALESAAQSDDEYSALQKYKKNIKELNKKTYHLSKLKEEIKKLSFGKGQKDAKRLAELKEKAAKLEKSINYYDRQLVRLEAMKPIKDLVQRERSKAYKAAAEKGREVLQKNIEGRHKSEARAKIKKLKQKFQSIIEHPTDRQYVPVDLMSAMIDVCDLIDTSTPLYKADGSINKAQQARNEQTQRLLKLKAEYDALAKSADYALAYEYEQEVADYIQTITLDYANRNISEMTLAELTDLYQMMRSIEETLRDARRLIGWSDAMTVYEAGGSIIEEQTKIGENRKQNGITKADDAIVNLSLSPVRAVLRMAGYNEDSALYHSIREIANGTREQKKFVMDAVKKFESLTTGKNASTYEKAIYDPYGKELIDKNGNKFHVTKMQMMQAIMSYEREMANDKLHHVSNGGFTFADIKLLGKGEVREAVSAKYAHTITLGSDVAVKFMSELANDKWAQEYMAEARRFFDETAKEAINEANMKLKHRIVATGKNYIPYEVNSDFIVREINSENDIQQVISGYGMLKDLKEGASQPLIITGLNNVLDRHIEQVGNVAALAVPIRNFNKIWNVKSTDGSTTVREKIKSNWGVGGEDLITQAVKDVQGSRKKTGSKLYKSLKSNLIGSTFLGNVSVVLKQIGSMYTATSMLNYRDPASMMANLIATKANRDAIAAEVNKYTAVAWVRGQGLSDAEVYDLKTSRKKSKLGRAVDKLPPALNAAKWITQMDYDVALSLWKYAKEDTAKRTGLKGEELLKATADYYNDVIENTQSMSDALHRPEVQKKEELLYELVGMFKTDLYQNAGLLRVALESRVANPSKENSRALVKAVCGTLSSMCWASLITSVMAAFRYKVDRYRDEEDDEITLDNWLKVAGGDMLEEMIGYMMPLFGGEAAGLLKAWITGETYEFDNLTLEALNDFSKALTSLGKLFTEGENDPEKILRVIKNVLVKGTSVFGVPANNVTRFFDAVRLHAKDIANGEFLSFEAGLTSPNAQRLYNAYIEGDADKIKKASRLYEDQKAIDSALRKQLRENDPRMNEAANAYIAGDYAKYNALRAEIIAEGIFDNTLITDALKAEINYIKNKDKESE